MLECLLLWLAAGWLVASVFLLTYYLLLYICDTYYLPLLPGFFFLPVSHIAWSFDSLSASFRLLFGL